jgi:hypothetical protein
MLCQMEVIDLLLKDGWTEDGATRPNSFRLSSLAYGGGPVVKLGNRVRLRKGSWKVTVGKRTTCFYQKPDNPETMAGIGRLAGKQVYTFKDWRQINIPTKDVERIKSLLRELEDE